jgi:hypothetical protein
MIYAGCVLISMLGQLCAYFSSMGYLTYFALYWTMQAFLLLLGCAAILEAFYELLSRYTMDFRVTVAVIVPCATVIACLGSLFGGRWRHTFVQNVLALQSAGRLFQVGALLLIFVLTTFFHLRWRRSAIGIALGFGIYGTAQVLGMALMRVGFISSDAFPTLDLLAYGVTTCIWLAYLFHPDHESAARGLPAIPIKEWNQALGELLQR